MKQVINGKTYNTETAIEIDSFNTCLGSGNFNNIDESLYVTQKDNYFLAGSGGAATRYSQPVGNMTSGGECIIAMSKDEALEWCEQHSNADIIEKFFEVEEA